MTSSNTPKRNSGRKIRADMKVRPLTKGEIRSIKSEEDRYVEEHHEGSFGVSRQDFMDLLTKSAQPVSGKKLGLRDSKTLESHPPDDYTDTHKNQDKTEGKEG